MTEKQFIVSFFVGVLALSINVIAILLYKIEIQLQCYIK